MRFPYVQQQTPHPVYPRGGVRFRLRPILSVLLFGPTGGYLADTVADTGADDTVFPSRMAASVGIDLTNARTGTASGVGGILIPCRYASVTLRLSDGVEYFEWATLVAFADAITRGLVGHVGFFDYFDVNFLGATKEVVILPNPDYPGEQCHH